MRWLKLIALRGCSSLGSISLANMGCGSCESESLVPFSHLLLESVGSEPYLPHPPPSENCVGSHSEPTLPPSECPQSLDKWPRP